MRFKRITLPIFMGLISVYISVLFCFGVIVGYILANFLAKRGKPVILSLGNFKLHLHHWMYSALGIIIIFISGIYHLYPLLLFGFLGGVTFHGIYCYDDWYKIVSRG